MEESGTAEIQEEANALIIHVNENAEIQREENTSSGYESQNEELHCEANASIESSEPLSTEYFIYKVPCELRRLNMPAYSPMAIVIGPFHRSCCRKKIETMEILKKRYFDTFLQMGRLQRANVEKFIMEREEKVRCYYEVQIGTSINRDDFVEMIMLDASFIIVIFLIFKSKGWFDLENQLQPNFNNIVRDIWLLENQLPFFVIKELYDFAFKACPDYPRDFTQLAYAFFEKYYTSKVLSYQPRNMKPLVGLNINHLVDDYDLKIKHLADLSRTFFRPPPQYMSHSFQCIPQRNRNHGKMHLNTASQLDEGGVKFKMGAGPITRLVDLKFRKGVLKIPCLVLDMEIESLFRNLVALEQRHYKSEAYITNYIRFLDFLIDTDKDVDLLVQKGIVINNLPDSRAVTTFFNNLGAHITDSDTNPYYYDLCAKLNKYSRNCRRGLIVRLRRDYFSNPWRTASTSAAIILLVLTFIQTVCSIISLQQN